MSVTIRRRGGRGNSEVLDDSTVSVSWVLRLDESGEAEIVIQGDACCNGAISSIDVLSHEVVISGPSGKDGRNAVEWIGPVIELESARDSLTIRCASLDWWARGSVVEGGGLPGATVPAMMRALELQSNVGIVVQPNPRADDLITVPHEPGRIQGRQLLLDAADAGYHWCQVRGNFICGERLHKGNASGFVRRWDQGTFRTPIVWTKSGVGYASAVETATIVATDTTPASGGVVSGNTADNYYGVAVRLLDPDVTPAVELAQRRQPAWRIVGDTDLIFSDLCQGGAGSEVYNLIPGLPVQVSGSRQCKDASAVMHVATIFRNNLDYGVSLVSVRGDIDGD